MELHEILALISQHDLRPQPPDHTECAVKPVAPGVCVSISTRVVRLKVPDKFAGIPIVARNGRDHHALINKLGIASWRTAELLPVSHAAALSWTVDWNHTESIRLAEPERVTFRLG